MFTRLSVFFILLTVFNAVDATIEPEKPFSAGVIKLKKGFGCQYCRKGEICAGPPHAKRCVIPIPVGKRCGFDPYWVCDNGLRCLNNVCKPMHVPFGKSCSSSGSICQVGTLCAGPPKHKVCVRPIGIGQFCGNSPYMVCKSGLHCRHRICVKNVTLGESCLHPGSVCTDGTICAGPVNKKVCVTPKPIGHRCGHDPFWVCRRGLKCAKGRCSTPGENGRAGTRCGKDWKCGRDLKCQRGICRIRKKRSCVGHRNACVLGTVCAGPLHKLRCVRPMRAGKRCGRDPYWVCARGLKCQRGRCRAPAGSLCKSSKMCLLGSNCVKLNGKKRCAVSKIWKKFPGDEFPGQIPVGSSCIAPSSVCVKGSVCAGTPHKKRCVIPKPVGHRCGQDPFWVCRRGLKCEKGRCVTLKGFGGPDKRGAGMRCGRVWKCDKGLKCQRGMCRIRKKRSCVGHRNACVLGTVCAGVPHKLRCVRPMTAGKQCGIDPYWVCQKGLACVDHVCCKNH